MDLMQSSINQKYRFLSTSLIAIAIILALWRSFTPIIWRIKETTLDTNAIIEASLWCVVVFGLVYVVVFVHLFPSIIFQIKRNWVLIVFIALAFISLAWSIAPIISFYRVIALVGSTCVGIYLGSAMDENKLLDVLFWAGVVIIILSFTLAIMYPMIGRMYYPPYDGAWRGLFWHKNSLGSIMSFFAFIYIFRALRNLKLNLAFLDIIFYLLSLGLVYLSHSAAGYIVLIFMHIAIIIAFTWVRIQYKLSKIHYVLICIISGIVALFFFVYLDKFFGLFNRSSDMTGRLQLWQYLLRDIVTQSPLFGHGFGAVWYLNSFRIQVQLVVGWTYPVEIGDNGFMDVLLHLGWVGLFIFIALFALMVYRAVRYIIAQKTFISFLPLLILCYAFLANLSFSLFFEIEYFVWMLMVATLFITTEITSNQKYPSLIS
jgi:O-antigen ligase